MPTAERAILSSTKLYNPLLLREHFLVVLLGFGNQIQNQGNMWLSDSSGMSPSSGRSNTFVVLSICKYRLLTAFVFTFQYIYFYFFFFFKVEKVTFYLFSVSLRGGVIASDDEI